MIVNDLFETSGYSLTGSYTPDLVFSKLWLARELKRVLRQQQIKSVPVAYVLGSWYSNLSTILRRTDMPIDKIVDVEQNRQWLKTGQKIQQDMKKLIAYSSISHMGFVTLGFFLFNQLGVDGAMMQMVSHGFISSAMFLSVGVLYDRVHSRQIADYGGVVNHMPKFAAFAVLFAMANAGLPGTSGFVGEFMVILGALQKNFWFAFLASTTLILGAAYTLWMVKRMFFGEIANLHVAELMDLSDKLAALNVARFGEWSKTFTPKNSKQAILAFNGDVYEGGGN